VGYLRGGGDYTLGVGVFNLRNASGPRNEGVGAAARVTFAPVNTASSTLHFGVSASTENANEGTGSLPASVRYAGRLGPSQGIATASESVYSVGLEAAGAFGPLFVQSEYARAQFKRPLGAEQQVETWYVMGSWALNGGHRAYKTATGVFVSPKLADKGLWELTARYDTISNKDIAGLEVNSWILGLNYYINPNLRVMFNYTQGENGFTGDETTQYALRTQLSF
jgi:phosphate-selective porin OprO/OprP